MSARLVRYSERFVPTWYTSGLQDFDYAQLPQTTFSVDSNPPKPYNEDDLKSWEHTLPTARTRKQFSDYVQPSSRERRKRGEDLTRWEHVLPITRTRDSLVEHVKPWALEERKNTVGPIFLDNFSRSSASLYHGVNLIQELWRPGRGDLDFEPSPQNDSSGTSPERSGLILEALRKEVSLTWSNSLSDKDHPVLYKSPKELTYQERAILNDFGHDSAGDEEHDPFRRQRHFFFHKASSNFISAEPIDTIHIPPQTPSWWVDIPIASRHSEGFKACQHEVLSAATNTDTFRPWEVKNKPSVSQHLEQPGAQGLHLWKLPKTSAYRKILSSHRSKQAKAKYLRPRRVLSSLTRDTSTTSTRWQGFLNERSKQTTAHKRPPTTGHPSEGPEGAGTMVRKHVLGPPRLRINRTLSRVTKPFPRLGRQKSSSITYSLSGVPGSKRQKSSLTPAARVSTGSVGKPFKTKADVEAFMRQPSWDISSLIGTPDETDGTPTERVTAQEVHHLLRLSALRIEDEATTEKQRQTLERQLNFVKAVQSVDTTGVEPLIAIRDETAAAQQETEITLESMQTILDKEEQVGRYKRIVPKESPAAEEAEQKLRAFEARERDGPDWDPLAQAASKVGRYIKVNTKKG